MEHLWIVLPTGQYTLPRNVRGANRWAQMVYVNLEEQQHGL